MDDDLTKADLERIEQTTQRLGREIFDRLDASRPGMLRAAWWDEQVLQLAMRDEAIKVQMFRFVDVLPMLHAADDVTAHLDEYFQPVHDRLPSVVRWAISLAAPGSLAGRAVARAARTGAARQAQRFIAASTIDGLGRIARQQRKLRRAFTIDILGEAVISQLEADRYLHAYLDLIQGVANKVNAWPEVPQIDRDHSGPIPRMNLSVKLSALDSQADEIDPAGTFQRVAPKLRELLRSARQHRAFINIDMESYHRKDLTLAVFRQVLMEAEFRDLADVGIVIQCYLKDSGDDLASLRDWARRRGTPIWVRLVKGAYWDYETVLAGATGWPVPVYDQKWQTDANFEQQCRFVIRNSDVLRPAIATHNIRSLAHSLALADHLRLPHSSLELQMLYGMADAEKEVLVDMGYRMRVYMPYGELIPGMAYLVRRLLENTSNDSFLRATFRDRVAVEKLMMDPREKASDTGGGSAKVVSGLTATTSTSEADGSASNAAEPARPYWQTFVNEPPLDFARDESREAFRAALDTVTGQMGKHHPLWIGTQRVDTENKLVSRDPSRKDRVVGTSASASTDNVQQAVQAAAAALPEWSKQGAGQRAEFLRKVARMMTTQRFELAAWQVYECGKGWREADADVCEAIDYLNYYAAGAVELDEARGVRVPGEDNRFTYHPRGVAAVIAPWNFPLAILTGMTAAAIATGNTVVMKPAEQSPVIAARLMELFAAADLPDGVVNYLPGEGEVAGQALVEHPDVALIVFTGSQSVGLAINQLAATASTTSRCGVKRVIAEMGGKNAILVDDDADLDEAVLGVVKSAFGYQGQKCSACSRAIILPNVYDTFLERLVEATRSLQVGEADDPSTSVGPLIDQDAVNKVLEFIQSGRQEAREVLSVDVGPLGSSGFYAGPHIFADVPPESRLAQEEIFGPVLAVIRAESLDDAIRIANATPYALTAGFYSRSPANLQRAACELLAGNLYLNRTCTGAIVGRQPFGGFKMSGTGGKAGGPDYLLQMVVPRTITENTMRRGFAPTA